MGVGASAGGLEAFTALLGALSPNPGFACVLVQHLDPLHESLLPEIVGRITQVPVVEAADGMRVKANHVYVIPKNAAMTIRKGVLGIGPRPAGTHLTIDTFFRSLAADAGSRAIGVVLSGTGSDGKAGLEAVKEADGVAIAQDPESAKFPEMPRAAIDSGCVDLVRPPHEIAAELERLSHLSNPGWGSPLRPGDGGDGDEMSDASLEPILAVLHRRTGVDFRGYKAPTIRRRVGRRMALHHLTEPRDYATLLEANRGETEALCQDILIKVTSFFRDPGAFEFLKKRVIAPLLKHRDPNTPIRVWVPGCSTGEEVYTIAMCFEEAVGEPPATGYLQIFGTDLSDKAIEKARAGLYPPAIAAEVSPARLRRFFTQVDGNCQISRRIREMCVLSRHDITRDPPFSRLDLVSCRNLLIYLTPGIQKRIIPTFHYALKPGGYLLLGNSETIGAGGHLFSVLNKRFRIYSRRDVATPVLPARGGLSLVREGGGDGKPGGRRPTRSRNSDDVQKDVEKLILARFSPPGVLVTEDLEVLQFRGRVAPYLTPSPGKATFNLLKMAHESLVQHVRLAVHQARKSRDRVRTGPVTFREGEDLRDVSIEVLPVSPSAGGDRLYLVLFEAVRQASKRGTGKQPRSSQQLERLVAKLQEELAATRENLQLTVEEQDATYEEFKSANEEILSSNEELQGTNEELETAKEELQSTNEELTTVNDELQTRNADLSLANDDIVNLLSSVNIPILMLGQDLRIRRFTPKIDRILNLVPTDVGRPLGAIRSKLNFPEFEHLLADAIDRVATVEREVQDVEGRWFQVTIRPYKTRDNKIDGAVVVFFDIDELKKSFFEAQLAREVAEKMSESVRQPIVFLDSTLRVRNANRALAVALQTTIPAVLGRLVFDLFPNEVPALRDALLRTLTQGMSFENLQVDMDLGPQGRRRLNCSGAPIAIGSAPAVVILTFDDVTPAK